jgi:hypothetical protein
MDNCHTSSDSVCSRNIWQIFEVNGVCTVIEPKLSSSRTQAPVARNKEERKRKLLEQIPIPGKA